MKLYCQHVDTCLPDFWSGHHLPHIQIPVYRGMAPKAVRESLHDELNECVQGAEAPPEDDDKWYRAAHAAIERDVTPAIRGTRQLFLDLEPETEDQFDHVYAFFVFTEE